MIDYGLVLKTITEAENPTEALEAFVMQEREHAAWVREPDRSWTPLQPSTPVRNGVEIETPGWNQYASDKYVVLRREAESKTEGEPPMIWLSIRNQDRSTRHDWRDFQRIKNQLAGVEYEGVEIYPAETRKIDTANQYHLFCFPFTLSFGLGGERMVTNSDTTQAAEPGAVQRDHELIDGPLNTLAEMLNWKDETHE